MNRSRPCRLRLFSGRTAKVFSLLVAISGIVQAQAQGFVEGNLKIISVGGAKLADESDSKATSANYAEYPLVILSSDGQKEIKRFTANANGHYRLAVPPGDYVLDVQNRAQKHVRARQQPFEVQSGMTVQVNIDLDTGVR